MPVIINTEEVVDFQMREPFATLFKTHKFLSGGPGASKLELFEVLYNAIHGHWNVKEADELASLDSLSNQLVHTPCNFMKLHNEVVFEPGRCGEDALEEL